MGTEDDASALNTRLWNDVVGETWASNVEAFDATLTPFGEAAIEEVAPQPAERVLDLGCGAGSTTLALGALVAPGEVVGVDISVPMLAVARQRAAAHTNVHFRELDVQEGELEESAFDVAFSRLGVMFFSNPLKAFTNVARALRPGGRLGFVCFQDAGSNPFILEPVLAAA